jgi:hypothetical protein
MLESFKMEMSQADFVRIVNAGIHSMNLGHELIERGDQVYHIAYKRDSKTYTLYFESGRKLKIVAAAKKDAA